MSRFISLRTWWKGVRLPLRIALMVNFFVFGMLANAVYFSVKYGLLIYLLDQKECQQFQYFQDVALLLTTFLVAPFIGVIGYRRAMRIAIRGIALMCVFVPIVSFFPEALNFAWISKGIFFITGAACALIFVASYMLVGDVSPNKRHHASTLALIEGMYAVGMFASYLIFGIFVSKQISWYYGYWLALPLIFFSYWGLKRIKVSYELHEFDRAAYQTFTINLRDLLENSLVWIFLMTLFLLVFIQKHFSQWILDFDKLIREATSLSDLRYKNIEVSMLVTLALAVSRIFAGLLMQKISPFLVFAVCAIGAMSCMLLNLYSVDSFNLMGINVMKDTGITILLLPLTAFFMGPILPIIVSTLLSQTEMKYQSPIIFMQMVVIVSGSIISTMASNVIFSAFSQKVSYSFTLIPIALIIVFFSLFYFDIKKSEKV